MELQLIHGPWPLYTNSFLLFTPSGSALVIDPNADPGVYEKALADRGARLTHILLTHGHYDHVGAVAALRATTGAKVHMDPADASGSELLPLTPDLVDEPWPDAPELTLDGVTFRIWRTPGHTPGGVCLHTGNLLFCGDTLFAGSCGRVDLPGGDTAAMRRSLALLAGLPLPDATQVLPGHGELSTLGQERDTNPYLQGQWF